MYYVYILTNQTISVSPTICNGGYMNTKTSKSMDLLKNITFTNWSILKNIPRSMMQLQEKSS